MNKKQIIDFLSEDADDKDFLIDGKDCSYCPLTNYDLTYDGQTSRYSTIEEAVDAPVFGGKSMVQLWSLIYPQIS